MCRHRSVSLNNEKNCCEISGDKIAFCEKTAGLRRGKSSDSNSACLKVLVLVKIFQFQDMLNESERYRDAANGLNGSTAQHKPLDILLLKQTMLFLLFNNNCAEIYYTGCIKKKVIQLWHVIVRQLLGV